MTDKADDAMGPVNLERTGTSLYYAIFDTEQEAKDALSAISDHVQNPKAKGEVDCISVLIMKTPGDD